MHQQSNSNLAQVCHHEKRDVINAGARPLSQRSINLHFLSVLLLSEWTIVARGIQFGGNSEREHVGLTRARFLCSLEWLGRAAYCEWADRVVRHQRMAVIHYFIFTQHQTLFTQMVQTIHWCVASLSRSQLNELISAATKQRACLHYPLFLPASGDRIMLGCNSSDHEPPTPPKILLFYGNRLVSSPENEILPAISNSRAFSKRVELACDSLKYIFNKLYKTILARFFKHI